MAAMTALVVASLALTAVGAGVSAYGQYQAGKTQNAIAQFNATAQENNARSQMQAMQAQSEIQRAQAEANFRLRSAEAAARTNNARAIEAQALNQDLINRTNLRKRREEFGRMQGEQRAAIAASGAVESAGTPLDLLAETASKIQQDQEEQHYSNELQRRTLFSEAAQERLGGKLALAGATLDRSSSVAEAGLRDAAGKAGYLAGLREAQITRLTGSAAKRAGAIQAGATIFSAMGDAGSSYARFKTS
jgi:hypothetical protein